MEKLIKEDKNPSMLRLWWHSHNSMDVSWSNTDEKTGKNFAGNEFLISIVINHAGKMRGKINLYNPIEVEIDNIMIVVEIPDDENENFIKNCKEEIKENVANKVDYYYDRQIELGFGRNAERRSNYSFPPLGEVFYDSGLKYTWDDLRQQYTILDVLSEKDITNEEAIKITGTDYNSPYWLNGDMSY